MKKTLIYGLILSGLVMYFGCKQDEMLGPESSTFTQPFTVTQPLQIDKDTANFPMNMEPVFTASFDIASAWKITITGQKSGAVKTYEGGSQKVSVKWDGTFDKNSAFFTKEKCYVELSFPKFPDKPTYKDSVYVSGEWNVNSGGIIVTDFALAKSPNATKSKLKEVYDGKFTDSTKWMSDYMPTTIRTTNPPAVDNSYYIVMEGTGRATDPYVDFLYVDARSADAPYSKFFPIPTNDASSVYFNLLMYNDPKNVRFKNGQLVIIMQEENNSAVYRVVANWTGWKKLSIKYSDFEFSNKQVAPKPYKIKGVQFVVITTVPQSNYTKDSVTVIYDHPIFTIGKPWLE